MNKKNKKREIERKRLEQKKLLIQMKKEIDTLEFDIKYSSLRNAKMGAIKNLKIYARALQLVAPYVVTAGIVAGGFALFGDIPFYPNDEVKAYSNVMTEFDNAGNIRKEQQYASFKDESGHKLDSNDNLLYYYSKWEKIDDGLYSRVVQTYSIDEKTYEDIIKLFDKKDLSLEGILGEPDSNIKETKNNLTEEELQEGAFIQAIVYSKDEGDYIIRKQTVGENIFLSILYVFVSMLIEMGPLYYRSEYSSFDFLRCVNEIKRKYQPLDIDVAKKQLELKKDNYNRLTR